MLIADKFIYIELHKTGSTHIRKLLKTLIPCKLEGEHNQIPITYMAEQKTLIGSIRNPLEWYLSLWLYGCSKKGTLYNQIKFKCDRTFELYNNRNPLMLMYLKHLHMNSDINKLYETYNDPKNVKAFRTWLEFILKSDLISTFESIINKTNVADSLGLMSYRFIWLYCKTQDDNKDNKFASELQSANDLFNNCLIDDFITNENLENDLIRIIKNHDYWIDKHHIDYIKSLSKSNKTQRPYPLNVFYDSKSIKLVNRFDRYIIQKFNY